MDDVGENAELVRRVAGHDPHGARDPRAHEAEVLLCRRFGPRALLYGRKHLRDEERARDLSQTVMIAVLEAVRAGRVEDPSRIDRFVLGTCRNVARRMRDADSRAAPTANEELDVLAHVPEVEPMDLGALARCLAELDGRGRSVVFLSFNEGRAAEDIASTLGTTAGNVRVVRHRAVAQLRQCMDDCKETAR
jgi:RNA polymerase sigma-70 factor (ECF subfamily)